MKYLVPHSKTPISIVVENVETERRGKYILYRSSERGEGGRGAEVLEPFCTGFQNKQKKLVQSTITDLSFNQEVLQSRIVERRLKAAVLKENDPLKVE